MSDRPELTRADLAGEPLEVLNSGRSHAPDVTVHEVDGEKVVLKDFGPKPWFWRVLLGRIVTAREAYVLRAVAGIVARNPS